MAGPPPAARRRPWDRPSAPVFAAGVAAALALGGCGTALEESETPHSGARPEDPRVIQPGAPGEGSRDVAPDEREPFQNLAHTDADVRFMQHMIEHHRQAVVMSRMVPEQTDNPDLRLLARRIDRSQQDEITMMARWLERRGEAGPEAAEGHHPASMPGILSEDQMSELSEARGEAFDRLFLEFMIFHHQGALEMVDELFASPGAGQESEIFNLAAHIDSDQRIEIGRMERMLRELADGG